MIYLFINNSFLKKEKIIIFYSLSVSLKCIPSLKDTDYFVLDYQDVKNTNNILSLKEFTMNCFNTYINNILDGEIKSKYEISIE